MNLSLKCFLSPARAARTIRELRKESEENLASSERNADRLADALGRLETLTDRTVKLQDDLDIANGAVRTLTDSLLSTRRQLDEANRKLRQADELRQSLANITAQYKEAERRIRSLQKTLEQERNADKKLFSAPLDNELMDIRPVTEPQFPLDNDQEENANESDKAVELPPLPPPLVMRKPSSDDDDDWLMQPPL
ncbi:MAG: hypothetical protein J6C81_07785 [Muribaculaceae bacterium]|nr:hypothetical protein [Muribaculaceae bacterium]